MRHLSAAVALSFMASSAFAAIVVDFVDHNGYKTENAKLKEDQDSWSSWTKENGVLKTTIKGDEDALLTAYWTENAGKKQLLLVNKSPYRDRKSVV